MVKHLEFPGVHGGPGLRKVEETGLDEGVRHVDLGGALKGAGTERAFGLQCGTTGGLSAVAEFRCEAPACELHGAHMLVCRDYAEKLGAAR